jgi:hypothetical protein
MSDVPAPAVPAGADSNKNDIETIEHAPLDSASVAARGSHKVDAAAELLRKVVGDAGGRIVVSPADDKRVRRRIDTVLLPILLSVYFLQQLDKATLAYASVFGLIDDTGLVGEQYSWLGSIVYLAQLVMQPLVAWLLVKLPIGKFSSTMVLFWGATLTGMAAAHDFAGLLTARFFLGAFEASIAPAFVAVTQMWWRRREQTLRVSSFYAMNGMCSLLQKMANECADRSLRSDKHGRWYCATAFSSSSP